MAFDYSENFQIREYRDTDYEEIIKFWDETELGRPERGDNRATIEETIRLGGILLVMEEKTTGKFAGTSWLTYDGRRVFLHHFGILPAFQGRGLANSLLRESLAFVRQNGHQVKLEVHTSNYKAINLYKKFGFEPLGDYEVYILRDISKL
jgi:ribosomal protein S18 acetylase RimI-like enzyme